jgi:hypothetical protein|tara:strand:+ start:292 stop:552 length:261 start_codon:yes stop_codon:yes gene_type:complete
MVKSEIINELKTSIVDIEFVKKDGTLRFMTCTLREESLPGQKDLFDELKVAVVNDDVLRVFDTIQQGWRSFRWDSLKTVNGVSFEQ